MKHIQLPVVALVALAANTYAQTTPVRSTPVRPSAYASSDLGRPGRFDIVLTPSFGSVSNPFEGWFGDQSGVGFDAQFHLPSVFFLKAGFKIYSDVDTYTFGLGVAIPAGNGRVTLGLDGTTLDIAGWGYEPQAALRASYDYNFSFGLKIGAGITHFVNSSFIGDDTTAPHFTIGYNFNKTVGLDLTLSSEDAILGAPESGSSANLAVRITL
jgi:hypothetical protein